MALQDLQANEIVLFENDQFVIRENINAKHKFAKRNIAEGDAVIMYGIKIGEAKKDLQIGDLVSTKTVRHATQSYSQNRAVKEWLPPDNAEFRDMTFRGYHRNDGKVGTRNYWLVFPLVFCENRNIREIEKTMLNALGYATPNEYEVGIEYLIDLYKKGSSIEEILKSSIPASHKSVHHNQLFPNVDGLKFITHHGGCGGTRQDSQALCQLLAGYVANPNVAGATVLSLGCQNAQVEILQEALNLVSPNLDKPIYILEQQDSISENHFISEAITKTFAGLMAANQVRRKQAPLSKIVVGLECGGSDGFSGITANPSLGYASDLLVSLGGSAILAEFPELNGVEQELINRCSSPGLAKKFAALMEEYNNKAVLHGSGFEMNPSPGNIRDGLITDAMKSAGAAKKGGTSPVVGVLDYTEQFNEPGLQLLCTPGNDVESTTGMAGSGANVIVFTTGLGTPTGNIIAPTIKVATNSKLANQMSDIIDLDAGTIIEGSDTIQTKGIELLKLIIKVASGELQTKAELLGQDDFIPWKRGISL